MKGLQKIAWDLLKHKNRQKLTRQKLTRTISFQFFTFPAGKVVRSEVNNPGYQVDAHGISVVVGASIVGGRATRRILRDSAPKRFKIRILRKSYTV